MQILITGITFTYSQGYQSPYTGVNIAFTTVGSSQQINLSGSISVTPAAYNGVTNGSAGYIDLVKNELLTELNAIA